ncbi:hypothetical protein WOC76_05575 [Methylocystis sp. IM3]|jgi:hypothetical protein|uniref:hypothetical protein n=1 Tax=unclassified Methylocystis TaxID=2625913 RepID=UPI0026A26FC7
MSLKCVKTIALATAIAASAGLVFTTAADAHVYRRCGSHYGWSKGWHRHHHHHWGYMRRAVYGYAAPVAYGYGAPAAYGYGGSCCGGCGTYGYAGATYAASPYGAYGYAGDGGLFGLGVGGGMFGLGLGPF